MPRTVERTVYEFSELSESAKERARDKYREHGISYDWWDSIYEDAVNIATYLGITIDTHTVKLHGGGTRQDPCIYFSGFWSQGDGAMFTGRYEYKADACERIKTETSDQTLTDIAAELTVMQLTARLQHTCQLEARITNGNHHYSHSGCMNVEVSYCDCPDGSPDVTDEAEKQLTDLMRRFADWIYAQLEAEDEYLNSDERVDECLADDEFDEDGDVV